MNAFEKAVAYSRAYVMFAEVYQHGLNDESREILLSDADASFDSAAHYQLFGHNVFPFEAIFLGTDGLLGGAVSERVLAFYQQVGFTMSQEDSPDHVSNEFRLMAYLLAAESDAIEDNKTHEVHRMQGLQRRFLDEHVLCWMPALVFAIEQQKTVFSEVARQSLDLVLSHRQHLGEDLMQHSSFGLPPVPDLLSDEKTSLKDIAAYLLIPSYTGFFLSSDDIKRLGSQFRLPHGFGKRQQILVNLLRTASDYGQFEEVLAALIDIAEKHQQQYQALDDLPNSIQDAWLTRLGDTVNLLATLRQLAYEEHTT